MISETRRTFMKLLGFTSIEAPRVMAELPALLSRPSTVAAFTAYKADQLSRGSGECSGSPNPQGPSLQFPRIIAQQIERLKREAADELYTRRAVREVKHLDGDLQAMRSVSLVNKQRMQRERDGQYESLMRQAEKMLYG